MEPIRMSSSDAQGLAMFEAAVLQDDRFFRAYKQLAAMLSASRGEHLLSDLTHYLTAVTDGRPRCMSAPGAAAMIVAALSVALGSPLFMSDDIFDFWALDASVFRECSRCGYRQPGRGEQCVLCAGKTGEAGIWERVRATHSAWKN